MTTLYDKLGGQGALDAFVPAFYEKVLADNRISHFFNGVDMDRQRRMLKAFLAMGFGGPDVYAGKDLRQGHKRMAAMGLDDGHFDAVAGHIKATLEDLNVSPDLIEEVLGAAEGLRADVLNKYDAEENPIKATLEDLNVPLDMVEEVLGTAEETGDDGLNKYDAEGNSSLVAGQHERDG